MFILEAVLGYKWVLRTPNPPPTPESTSIFSIETKIKEKEGSRRGYFAIHVYKPIWVKINHYASKKI